MFTLLGGCHVADAGDREQAAQRKAPVDYVIDRANLLPEQAEQAFNKRLAALEAHTTDQFVVVTLPTLDGQSIEDVSLSLGNSWGVGQKGKDNGVLLIVAPVERKVRIEVGKGLVSTLTDQICERIIQNDILPHFREGRMEQGIAEGVKAILGILQAVPVRTSLKKAA